MYSTNVKDFRLECFCFLLSCMSKIIHTCSVKSVYYPSGQSCQFQACHANSSTQSASHESNKHARVSLLLKVLW